MYPIYTVVIGITCTGIVDNIAHSNFFIEIFFIVVFIVTLLNVMIVRLRIPTLVRIIITNIIILKLAIIPAIIIKSLHRSTFIFLCISSYYLSFSPLQRHQERNPLMTRIASAAAIYTPSDKRAYPGSTPFAEGRDVISLPRVFVALFPRMDSSPCYWRSIPFPSHLSFLFSLLFSLSLFPSSSPSLASYH